MARAKTASPKAASKSSCPSLADLLRQLPPDRRSQVLSKLTAAEQAELSEDWRFWARPNQLPPELSQSGGPWRCWLLLAGRGFGKALSLSEPLPTPTGWTTMGAVRVGDQLFDEKGRPCMVTFATEVMHGRDCYEVVFDDGTVIVADAEHQWLTKNRRTRKAERRRTEGLRSGTRPQHIRRYFPAVVTTDEIRATLHDGRERNHAIDVAAPLSLPDVPLAVEPYTLGVWLGDGDSASAVLTSSDEEIVEELRAMGCAVGAGKLDSRSSAVRYSIGYADKNRDPKTGRMQANGSLHSGLSVLGVLKNKHIPQAYLRASVAQRMALLQGLMDTDGSVSPGGACEFLVTSEALARGVYELVLTLGLKPSWSESRAKLNGRDCGPRYRITFTPHVPVFRLPRKRVRQHFGKAQRTRVGRRYIVDVRPCPSVPVRCIQVDSPSHLFLASRSFVPTHNTRVGAEWTHMQADAGVQRMTLAGPTASDVRDIMVLGESGILNTQKRWNPCKYIASKRRVIWKSGMEAILVSADEPDRFRGLQHEKAWADELAAWRRPEAWKMMLLGLRLGGNPQVVATTTPKPVAIVRDLLTNPSTAITRGSTYDNATNLAPGFLDQIVRQYKGTRLERQEIYAEVLEDMAGALWNMELIERQRCLIVPSDLARVVIGVDPSLSNEDESNECGIIAAAKTGTSQGKLPEMITLDDFSMHGSPDAWARRAVEAYHQYSADSIVAEINQGGDMVERTLRTVDPNIKYKAVRATRGKVVRAEPIAALYEQGRAWHLGSFPKLEQQMCLFTPDMDPKKMGFSPDRVDALVWAGTDLMVELDFGGLLEFYRRENEERIERLRQRGVFVPQPSVVPTSIAEILAKTPNRAAIPPAWCAPRGGEGVAALRERGETPWAEAS